MEINGNQQAADGVGDIGGGRVEWHPDMKAMIRPVCMPDGKGGTMFAPELLTEEEAIRFLRFRDIGVKIPKRALSNLRHTGRLGVVRQCRKSMYPLQELLRYVQELKFND